VARLSLILVALGACGGGGAIVGSPAAAFEGTWSLVSGTQTVECGQSMNSASPLAMSETLTIEGSGAHALAVVWSVANKTGSDDCMMTATAGSVTSATVDDTQTCGDSTVIDGSLAIDGGTLSFKLDTEREIAGVVCYLQLANDFSSPVTKS
jgi:hypothetical protein